METIATPQGVIGASLSEPRIDEFAVNFIYIYIYLSYIVPCCGVQ